jgi:hypothetical protein
VRTRRQPQLIRAELRVLANAGLLVFTHLSSVELFGAPEGTNRWF